MINHYMKTIDISSRNVQQLSACHLNERAEYMPVNLETSEHELIIIIYHVSSLKMQTKVVPHS
jgi:hypothetical protein